MKIFVAHSSNFDFKAELYTPLRNSSLNKEHEIVLPQEHGKEVITKDIIKSCDVVIAEVSYPSTGSGIEIGWADIFKIPVICVYKEGSKISSSLDKVTNTFVSYTDSKDMINALEKELSEYNYLE